MSADSPLTPAQRDDLRTIAAVMIPASGEFDVPDVGITVELILQLTIGRNEFTLKIFELARAGNTKEATKRLEGRLATEQALLERVLGVPSGSMNIFEPEYCRAMVGKISKPPRAKRPR